MFYPLNEGDTVLVRRRGGYRQLPLYVARDVLFYRDGSTYYLIRADGTTSQEGTGLCRIETPHPLWVGPFQRIKACPPGEPFDIAAFNEKFNV